MPPYIKEYTSAKYPDSWETQGQSPMGQIFIRPNAASTIFSRIHQIIKTPFRWAIGKAVVIASIDRDLIRAAGHLLSFIFLPYYIALFCFKKYSIPVRVLFTILCLAIYPLGLAVWAYHRLTLPYLRGMQASRAIEREKRLQTDGASRVSLTTPDGCVLDGLLYLPPDRAWDRMLLETNGTDGFYEYTADTQLARAKTLGVPMLVINPRGVGESTGTPTAEGLELDVYTMYRFALDLLPNSLSPSNILLHGNSLGGGYGTRAAALIQEEYPNEKISVVNTRSFESLDKVIFHGAGSGIFARIACAITRWSGWVINSFEAMEKLNGSRMIVSMPIGTDHIVTDAASMREACWNKLKACYNWLENLGKKQHGRSLTQGEKADIIELIRSHFSLPAPHALAQEAPCAQ